MKIIMATKNVPLNQMLKAHIEEKTKKLQKFCGSSVEANWTVCVDGPWHYSTLVIRGKNAHHQARSKTTNMYASIESSVKKIEKQLSKQKEKKISGRANDSLGAHSVETDRELWKKVG